MLKNLSDIRTGREENHLMPFLWMHSGHRSELRGFVNEVYASGARAFCVESRPHEGFCEDEWWGDMDEILDEATKLGMKVWILDDKHYPTGYANGLVPKKYPHLRKWQLIEHHVDVVGPARESAVLLPYEAPLKTGLGDVTPEKDDPEDVLIGVYAYKRVDGSNDDIVDEPIDLTDKICGRYVIWDVPKGVYRVFALYKSRKGTQRTENIHMIDMESVHVLIEAVYEKHYEHYKKYFGNTIAGFFSDEPCFGNCRMLRGGMDPGGYEYRVGLPGLALPWNDELLKRLNAKIGGDCRGKLAGLWFGFGDTMPEIRIAYMDVLTELWRECFSYQIGNWCRDHNVEYIGHIIEDANAHARTGASAGHYFRSLDGQDMAGIDVVLHQIIPGLGHYTHSASVSAGYADSEFFDYVLARLAASHSHLQPRMKGRAMCEIFGAYGWAEGTPFMRRLMDHMLIRGINNFVPHAFSPDYPDPDCPPHFSAGGLNPEFEGFAKLMKYTNNVSHLLSGGVEQVACALLYHAEADWSGKDYMLMQKPAKALYDSQLNYDIVPADAIIERSAVKNGKMAIEKMDYPCIVVPYAQYLPKKLLDKFTELINNGLKIAFINARPDGYDNGEVVTLDNVAEFVRGAGGNGIRPEKKFELLRSMHVKQDDTDIFMISNESMEDAFDGMIELPVKGKGVCLDILNDTEYSIDASSGKINVKLLCGQSLIYVLDGSDAQAKPEYASAIAYNGTWTLALKPAIENSEFSKPTKIDALYNVTGFDGDPDFAGTMRYNTEFDGGKDMAAIDLGEVGSSVHAYLNGNDLGVRIDAPYVFDITKAVKEGKNELEVYCANSMVHKHPDRFSTFMQIAPSGLMGPVKILTK